MAEEPLDRGVALNHTQFWCSVCLDLLKEPVKHSLCGHSYCRICIDGCWDLEEKKGEYSCLQCSTAVLPLGKNTMLVDVMLLDLQLFAVENSMTQTHELRKVTL